MTGKQRVSTALRHIQPDRAPVVYNGAKPDLAEEVHRFYGVEDEPNLWLKLGLDFWYIRYDQKHDPNAVQTPKPPQKEPAEKVATSQKHYPLEHVQSAAEVDAFFSHGAGNYDYDGLYEDCKDEHKDKFRFCNGGGMFEGAWHIRGFPQLLEDFYINPKIAEAIFENRCVANLERIENTLSRFNTADDDSKIDMVFFGDDMGTQEDLIFSVDMFRKFLKPRWKRMTELAHSYGAVAAIHSCGSVYHMIPELIEAGIDILNVVQISARNMEPEKLKREFGSDITFWGAIDVQTVLPKGAPQDVKKNVRRIIDIMGEDGGYICSPTHVVQEDVSLENLVAFFEEALKI